MLTSHCSLETQNKKRIRCCLCDPEKQLHSYNSFQNHLRDDHEKSILMETLTFKNEFGKFKFVTTIEYNHSLDIYIYIVISYWDLSF